MEVISRLRRLLRELLPGGDTTLPRRPRRVTDSLVRGGTDGGEVVQSLVDCGVLVQRGEEVELSEGFRRQWENEMEMLADLDEDVFAAAVTEVGPEVEDTRAVTDRSRKFVVVDIRGDEDPLWLSRPVAIAEIAALRAFSEAVPEEHREAAARPLRLFLDECPDCGGRVDFVNADNWALPTGPKEEADEILFCQDCNERLYWF